MASTLLRRVPGAAAATNAKSVFGIGPGDLMKGVQTAPPLKGFATFLRGGAADAPPGLGNIDNSCYQNSVLQGLASLRTFHAFLHSTTTELPGLSDTTTNVSLFETISKLNDKSNKGETFWTPSKLKSMSSWQQQDAQEYFSKILDEVDKEIMKASRSVPAVQGLEGSAALLSSENHPDTEEGNQAPNNEWSNTLPSATSSKLRQNPVEGLLGQRVGCTRCGYSEGLSMIPFNCLTVPLGREWAYDIRDCLDEYTKLEPIEGVECARCTLLRTEKALAHLLDSPSAGGDLRASVTSRLQAVQDALRDEDLSDNTLIKKCQVPKKYWMSTTKTRQAVVARPPPSLVIHVNRSVIDPFSGAQRKNTANVVFPETLDLGPWCLGSNVSMSCENTELSTESWKMEPTQSMLFGLENDASTLLQYELRAVITHRGLHENGHYVCFRKHPYQTVDHDDIPLQKKTEQWWRLSDEYVSEVEETDVLNQGGVFMLFYERIPLERTKERVTERANLEVTCPAELATTAVPMDSPVATGSEQLDLDPMISPPPVPDLDKAQSGRSTPGSFSNPQTPSSLEDVSDAECMSSEVIPSTPATTTDDESEIELESSPAAGVVPIQPLFMRTAAPQQSDESMSNSPIRMVAAT